MAPESEKSALSCVDTETGQRTSNVKAHQDRPRLLRQYLCVPHLTLSLGNLIFEPVLDIRVDLVAFGSVKGFEDPLLFVVVDQWSGDLYVLERYKEA